MAELNLRRKARGASAHAPGHDRLGDAARLHRLDEVILIRTTDLTQQQEELRASVILVAQEVVQESAARVPVSANGHTFVDTVRVAANDVVELIRHAAGLGNVSHGARPVEPRHDDVVEHATSVANAQATWLDAANGGRADEADLLLLSHLDELACLLLRHTLCNNRHGLDLRVLHGLSGGLVHGAEGGEVHKDGGVRVLLARLLGRCVDGHERFLSAPVELHIVVAREREDHGLNRGLLALAHVVKIEHALHRTVLHAVDNGCGLWSGGHDGVLCGGRRRLSKWRGLFLHLDHLAHRRAAGLAEIGLRQGLDEAKSHRDHRRDVGFRAINLQAQTQLLSRDLDLAQALDVVGPSAADHDLDLVLLDVICIVLQCLDEAGESCRHICEVGNTATDDEEFAIRVLGLHHEREQCLRIGKSFLCRRSARVLAVVGKFVTPAIVRDSVSVDNGGTAACNHGPDPTLLVEDRELQRSTGLAVHVTDQSLLRVSGTSEWWGPVDLAPLLRAEEPSGLVKLGSHVQRHNRVILQHHERVDLEIGKVQVLVELVEAYNEGGKTPLLLIGHLAEQLCGDNVHCDFLAGGQLQPLRFGVNIAHVHTALVVEQYLVKIALREEADVELL
mmetsp:Transcript_79918/g.185577  ORF Transcript_79918/g.185577 Transcript_79918/m.185577 type:complete len:619 (-) Transcript_79918:445-2301(-)